MRKEASPDRRRRRSIAAAPCAPAGVVHILWTTRPAPPRPPGTGHPSTLARRPPQPLAPARRRFSPDLRYPPRGHLAGLFTGSPGGGILPHPERARLASRDAARTTRLTMPTAARRAAVHPCPITPQPLPTTNSARTGTGVGANRAPGATTRPSTHFPDPP